MSTTEILNNGMQCLREKMGVVEAEKFISIIIREQFDYTKWQREHFDKINDAQFNDEVASFAKNNPHTGNAKIVL